MREQVIALKGNHEAVALGVVDGTMPADYWLNLGGAATLRSYGVDRAQALPAEHVDWLRSLRSSYDDGRRFFVHAGIDPEQPLDAQREHDMLWIREPFLSDQRDYARLIVHGHTPLASGTPDLRGNRLNLDTAAVFGGPLTAAVFAGDETRPIGFLQATLTEYFAEPVCGRLVQPFSRGPAGSWGAGCDNPSQVRCDRGERDAALNRGCRGG